MDEDDEMDELDNTLLQDNLAYLKKIKTDKTAVKLDMDVTYYQNDDDETGFEEDDEKDYLNSQSIIHQDTLLS